MGCGASKQSTVIYEQNDDPPLDTISVPDISAGYPPPTPPRQRKQDIYKPQDYANIDARVRQQQARINTSTYETLVNSLTAGCSTDLQKLRAIYVWLYLQEIYGSFYSGVTDPYTPRGYMKLIKTRNGSYASFFALLCRAAGIPCNVIRGVGKGDEYVLGQQNISNLESAWNAVHVAGEWRLVHPLWSFFQEKQTYENGLPTRPETKRSSIEEFYWLTDPDAFICFCKSNAHQWQLLKLPWNEKQFLNKPYFTEAYFNGGLQLPNTYNVIINCDTCNLLIGFDHEKYTDPTIDADVEREKDNSDDRRSGDINKKEYIATASSSTTKTLFVRFPMPGWYNLDVFGGIDKNKPKLVSFRILCKHRGKEPQPLPLNPREGFGILQTADRYGVSDPDPDMGIILVRPGQQKRFSFTCMQQLVVIATLSHIKHDPDNLADCVATRSSDSQLDVTVDVPEESPLEFALQIAIRKEKERGDFAIIANYLLVDENWLKNVATITPSKDEVKHQSKDDTIRRQLIAATNRNDIEALEHAIAEFERNGLADNGDLTRAKNKLAQLRLEANRQSKDDIIRRQLIAETNRNDIEALEDAIGEFERNGLPDNGDLTRAKNKLAQLRLEANRQGKDDAIRRQLIAATSNGDIETLERAIGEFERNCLSDNGDLTRAKSKLVQLHLENLRSATLERQLPELEKAIDSANESHVASDLKASEEMAEAERTRQQLRRLKLFLHKVLSLNKATIAEIHSYQRPRPLVHEVMKATFRILGEPNVKLQDWSRVQTCMRQLGYNSMLSRMGRCDVVRLKKRQVDDAENYLNSTNRRSVRTVSAGAATFYVWSNHMISEYRGKGDEDKSARSTDEGTANGKRYKFNSSYTPSPAQTARDELKSR